MGCVVIHGLQFWNEKKHSTNTIGEPAICDVTADARLLAESGMPEPKAKDRKLGWGSVFKAGANFLRNNWKWMTKGALKHLGPAIATGYANRQQQARILSVNTRKLAETACSKEVCRAMPEFMLDAKSDEWLTGCVVVNGEMFWNSKKHSTNTIGEPATCHVIEDARLLAESGMPELEALDRKLLVSPFVVNPAARYFVPWVMKKVWNRR